MFDAQLRAVARPPLTALAGRVAAAGVRADQLTLAGWAVGTAACIAAGLSWWPLALVLWLANRLLDGLDGAVARAGTPSDAGGFLDVMADFTVYAGFVLAVAIARPEARLACVALLAAYYASAVAFLTLSSLVERRRQQLGDERSIRFVGGLAEGAETIAVYVLICLWPGASRQIAWVFAAAVAVTAGQRIWWGVRLLRRPVAAAGDGP